MPNFDIEKVEDQFWFILGNFAELEAKVVGGDVIIYRRGCQIYRSANPVQLLAWMEGYATR